MKLGTSTNMFNCRRGSLAKPTYAEMTAAAADAGFDVIDIDLSGASSACTSVQPLYLHPRQTAGRR